MPGVVITGGSSGLGLALVQNFLVRKWKVVNLSNDGKYGTNGDYMNLPIDVRELIQVESSAEVAKAFFRDDTFCLINCAAVNLINWLEDVEVGEWNEVMDTNAKGIFLTCKVYLEQLMEHHGGGIICNVISDAAHKPMTGSLAYNASKGAAHIMTLQLARELTRRYGITAFGVAPGKMAHTKMSEYIDKRVQEMRRWTPEQAEKYAQMGRLRVEELPPALVAKFICTLIVDLPDVTRYLTGSILPIGA